jgi:nitroreductase
MASTGVSALRVEDPETVEEEAGRASVIKEVPQGAPWTMVEDVIFRRRSIRKYKRKQVSEHLVRRILEAGRFAPSQGNCQPWKFIVVRDADMIQEMENFCVDACKKLSRTIDYTTQPKGTFRRFVKRLTSKVFNRLQPNMMHPVPVAVMTALAEGRFAVFHKAPTVILLLMNKRGIGVPEIDIGICGTNIVLAAQSLGLGTCWVGFSKFLGQNKQWCERLGVKEPYELVEAITVGYPIGDPTRLISRDTPEISWFEGGRKQSLY